MKTRTCWLFRHQALDLIGTPVLCGFLWHCPGWKRVGTKEGRPPHFWGAMGVVSPLGLQGHLPCFPVALKIPRVWSGNSGDSPESQHGGGAACLLMAQEGQSYSHPPEGGAWLLPLLRTTPPPHWTCSHTPRVGASMAGLAAAWRAWESKLPSGPFLVGGVRNLLWCWSRAVII